VYSKCSDGCRDVENVTRDPGVRRGQYHPGIRAGAIPERQVVSKVSKRNLSSERMRQEVYR
jgi:hypothetical protein